jgi:high-affinity nickel permease
MLGLDDQIAQLSSGASLAVVLLVAVLLGLRHATDPDHLAAVATLVASRRERVVRNAARLGAFWGLGHATTLLLFGLPIVLADHYLPAPLQRGAETVVAALIVLLAVRLLHRWRTGYFRPHDHEHDHRHRVRTPLGAFGIGLVHGLGGSAGVGVLLLAAIPSRGVAVVSLLVLALCTAASMTMLTTGFGLTLRTRPVAGSVGAVAPVLGLTSLAFGCWYAAAVWSVAPYPF